MTDRPILFSAPMVRALLDGRKTQTRRVLKPQPTMHEAGDCSIGGHRGPVDYLMREIYPKHMARFRKGDRLYVREAWRAEARWDYGSPAQIKRRSPIYYAADPDPRDSEPGCAGRKRPGIHMPRWASRLTLTVTDVRVQRLQEISEADAIAEGATARPRCSGFLDVDAGWSMDWSRVGQPSKWATDGKTLRERDISLADARCAFWNFFNHINGAGSWEANPFVVAVSFSVTKANIDAARAA